MVNPYTYSVFYVTAEPVDDPDPNPSSVVVGVELPNSVWTITNFFIFNFLKDLHIFYKFNYMI